MYDTSHGLHRERDLQPATSRSREGENSTAEKARRDANAMLVAVVVMIVVVVVVVLRVVVVVV